MSQSMLALRLHEFGGLKSLRVESLPLPKLERDEILIKVEASPINPSDDLFCEGLYQIPVTLPVTPGFEGSGLVVATGQSWVAKRLRGKWVAAATQRGDGFWAQYVKVKAVESMPFNPKDMAPDQASMSFVNPLTALALIEPLLKGEHRAMVQTAAASQLGLMIARLAQRHKLTVIHCVHRAELVKRLQDLGAQYVLDTSQPDFIERLTELSRSLSASYAIDAVGGALTGRLAEALANHSKIVVYGALAKEAVTVDPGAFIFKDQHIEGFWLGTALARKSILAQFLFLRRAKANLTQDLRSEVHQTLALTEVADFAAGGLGPASRGKTLIKP